MFKTMFWACACVFVLGSAVQLYADKIRPQQNRSLYCLVLKDGIPVLVSEGKPVLTEVVFENGTKIKTDGTVTKKDGTSFVLKTGECVNDSAHVSVPVVHEKNSINKNNNNK
jgi:hypothetical protein